MLTWARQRQVMLLVYTYIFLLSFEEKKECSRKGYSLLLFFLKLEICSYFTNLFPVAYRSSNTWNLGGGGGDFHNLGT